MALQSVAPVEAQTGTTPRIKTTNTIIANELAVENRDPQAVNVDHKDAAKEIHVMRGKTPDRKRELLNAAYVAYLAGNYDEAAQGYLGVLADMPDNRNALQGMAAIAQRTGGLDTAWQAWLKVLAFYPDDPVATAALINLMDEQNYAGNAQVMGKLLQDHPHAAYLYFALGNLQASASRWAEARQSFAEACRLDSDNADYIYNLAVSLEHARDDKAALAYYSSALELARDRAVNFDRSVVMARITALSENSAGH